MKPKDIFGIVVRLLGLAFLCRGLWLVPAAADELFRGVVDLSPYRMFSGLWIAGWPFIAAFWLMRGAPPFSQIAYPDPPNSEAPRQPGKE